MTTTYTFLEQVYTNLQHSVTAYKQYIAAGKIFLYAQQLRLYNDTLRRSLEQNMLLLSPDLQKDAAALLHHYTVWTNKWDALQQSTNPKPHDEFVFANEVTFPKQAASNLEQAYIQLKNNEGSSISIATLQDIPALVILLNSAYRGDASKSGWTTEADLLKGEHRTDETNLHKLMTADNAVFLKYTNAKNEIEGCVFLQKKQTRLYLGMLSVSPKLQAKGTGKRLMAAAVLHAKAQNCMAIFMRVISVRKELIAWYEKLGYADTGVKEPFPADDRFGIPTQPLEFIIMEKKIV